MKLSIFIISLSILCTAHISKAQSCESLNTKTSDFKKLIKAKNDRGGNNHQVLIDALSKKCNTAMNAFLLNNPEAKPKDFKKYIGCDFKEIAGIAKRKKTESLRVEYVFYRYQSALDSLEKLIAKGECGSENSTIALTGCRLNPRKGFNCQRADQKINLGSKEYCCQSTEEKVLSVKFCEKQKTKRQELANSATLPGFFDRVKGKTKRQSTSF